MQLFKDNDYSLVDDNLICWIDTLCQNKNGRIDQLLYKWKWIIDLKQTSTSKISPANCWVCFPSCLRVRLRRGRDEAPRCSARCLCRPVRLSFLPHYITFPSLLQRVCTLWYLASSTHWQQRHFCRWWIHSWGISLLLIPFCSFTFCIITSAADESRRPSCISIWICKTFAQYCWGFKDPHSSFIPPPIRLLVAEWVQFLRVNNRCCVNLF